VIRGSHLGESHGGVYRIDLERGTVEQKLDWNGTDIDVAGRGGDRGLRGIAFHDEHILLASNAALLILDQDFAVLESYTNPYLRHCHEISVACGHVFLTATGCDSILAFNLNTRRFVAGWHLRGRADALELRPFDPASAAGPPAGHRFHLNSVAASGTGFTFSGLHTPGLLRMDGSNLRLVAPLPEGTHNAQLLGDDLVYNDTVGERVCCRRRNGVIEMPVPRYARHEILNIDRFASDVARPSFARGLCALSDTRVAAGSSPSTIAVYDVLNGGLITQQNLSMDVRNAVHGLAVWPFS